MPNPDPKAPADVTGAMQASPVHCPDRGKPEDADLALRRAVQLAAELGSTLCDLPTWQARALLGGVVGGVEAVTNEGMGVIAGAPTSEELYASWKALEPEQESRTRTRHEFIRLWNALTDRERASFVARITGRGAAA